MAPFLVILAGQACSLCGSELVQFALIWWLIQAGGSATTLAFAALIGLLPTVLVGPLAGALVDRWNRRAVMIVADGAIAFATLVLALLFILDVVLVWHVYVLLFVRALGGAFHWPAMQASASLMVPERHLARVAGVSQALRGVASVGMPPLAAVLLSALPLPGILLIDVGTALLAIAPLLLIAVPQPRPLAGERDADGRPSVWGDLRAGLRYVWRWRGLAALIALVSLLHFWAAPAFALMPIVVVKHFGRGAPGMAWTQAAFGAGLLAGGLLLGAWGGFRRRIVTVLSGISLMGVCLALVGLVPRSAFGAGVFVFACSGLLAPIVVGSFQAIQQAVVPPAIQGRVLALARSGMDLMSPLGLAVAGPVADALGFAGWYLVTGVVMVAMAGGAFLVPALVGLEKASAKDRAGST